MSTIDKFDDQHFPETWENIKTKKKLRFFAVHALIFALMMYVFINLLELRHKTFPEAYFSVYAFLQFLFNLLGGLLIGYINWRYNEKRYRKLKEKRDLESNPPNLL